MPSDELILDVENLHSRSAQGWTALQHASFSVSSEECVAVIGPNGSGKSSLLKVITGEYPLTQGHVMLSGSPLDKMPPQQKAKNIAVVAQNDYVDPRLTVQEYIGLGRVPHAFCCSSEDHKAAIDSALQDVALSNKRVCKMGELSGGEQQRAHIARAFAQDPKLLLLDEPTNHLDPLARLELLELIRRKKIASIAVLHDLSLIASFAHKIVLMSEQRMVRCGTVEDIMQKKYITPVFGLNVLTFSHPDQGNAIHHFEAASC